MNDVLVKQIVTQVLERMGGPAVGGSAVPAPAALPALPAGRIPVEVSSRHVHLSAAHLEALFGPGHILTQKRALSQPGQFLSEERVRLIGPRGVLDGVAILGPVRGATQAELSASDARILGIDAPVRMSGDLSGAADLLITAGEHSVSAPGCAIVAKTHIHMTPADAAAFGVQGGQRFPVRVCGARPLVFEGVEVRVDAAYRLAMHMDMDEANACLCGKDGTAQLLCGKTYAPLAVAVTATAPAPGAVQAPTASTIAAARPGRRAVISAEEAKALCAGGQAVVLPRGSVVTPLARDVFNDAKVRYSVAE